MKRNSIAMLGVCGALAAALAIPAAIVTVAESPAQSRRRVPIVIADDATMRPWVRYAGWPTRDFSRFNTLASTVSPSPSQEPRRPSGPIPGDPAIGQKLAGDRSRGGHS